MKESPCIPLPDPVRENEVKLTLQWSADAEKYVAAKLKGSLPDSIHCPHDVLSASGHQFEIKFSKLTSPNKSGAPFSRVWKWNRLLGDRRNKVYDRLILVGLATKRAQAEDRRDGHAGSSKRQR